jgi:probable rRNA maturation factor
MPTVTPDPNRRTGRIRVALANEQSTHVVDERQLVEAATAIIRDSTYTSAAISLAVVNDSTMHELNRRHLGHDYPTDVLSFVLESDAGHLEGEVIISSDTAAAAAEEHGWPAAAEQLLYVIHGTLHLVGYRDKLAEDNARMRAVEEKYLWRFGVSQACGSNGRDASTDSRVTLDDGESGP